MNIYAEQRAMLARMVRTRDETRRHIELIGQQIEKRAGRITVTAFRDFTNSMGDRQ